MYTQAAIAKQNRKIDRLKSRLTRRTDSVAYRYSWHRKHSATLRDVKFLRDEISIEESLLFRMRESMEDQNVSH